jgi:ABC-type nitrate/sulfonate/bicarbonate transport system permease component
VSVSMLRMPDVRSSLRARTGGAIGLAAVLVIWQLAGAATFKPGGAVPPPTAILHQMTSDGFEFYWRHVAQTGYEAGLGWLWGNGLAVVGAVLFVTLPLLERPLMRVSMISFCLPVIAIAPILQVLFPGATPKVILAALSVFFTTLIGMMVGLKAADKRTLDVVRAYGGSSWQAATKIRVRYSLPSLFAALQIAAPAAVLGAIIGEYIGGETGLGVAMVNSQESLLVERTWALAIVSALLSGLAYAVTAIAGRLAAPWAPRQR